MAERRRRSAQRPVRPAIEFGLLLGLGMIVVVETTWHTGWRAASATAPVTAAFGAVVMYVFIRRDSQ